MTIAGPRERQPDSVCCVSYWRIPQGTRYDYAEVIRVYFNNREAAEQVAARYANMPEMAIVEDLPPITKRKVVL